MVTLLYILLGLLIGWNFPQPSWAKAFQSKYLQKYIDPVKAFFAATVPKE